MSIGALCERAMPQRWPTRIAKSHRIAKEITSGDALLAFPAESLEFDRSWPGQARLPAFGLYGVKRGVRIARFVAETLDSGATVASASRA